MFVMLILWVYSWVFQNAKAESLDSKRQVISLLENGYMTSIIKG